MAIEYVRPTFCRLFSKRSWDRLWFFFGSFCGITHTATLQAFFFWLQNSMFISPATGQRLLVFWKRSFWGKASLGYFIKYTSHFSFHTSLFQLLRKKIIQPKNPYQTSLGTQRDPPLPTPKFMKEVDSSCTPLFRNILLARLWLYELNNRK